MFSEIESLQENDAVVVATLVLALRRDAAFSSAL